MVNERQKKHAVPIFGLGGGSFVIGVLGIVTGAIFFGKTTCDQDIMPLPVWLLVVGCVSMCGSGVTCCCIRKVKVNGLIVGASIQGAFLLAWNILGAVLLFRGSMNCEIEAKPMWAITLVILCLQWACVALTIFYYTLLVLLACIKRCIR